MSGEDFMWPFKNPLRGERPGPSGPSAEEQTAVREERERLERRRRGRGGTILTSPTGAPLGLPGSAPRLTGGATILGG